MQPALGKKDAARPWQEGCSPPLASAGLRRYAQGGAVSAALSESFRLP
jgi:hypothetical protein